jgi:hypothetical protein
MIRLILARNWGSGRQPPAPPSPQGWKADAQAFADKPLSLEERAASFELLKSGKITKDEFSRRVLGRPYTGTNPDG